VESLSERAWREANEILALGGHQRSLLRPLFHGEEGVHPHFAVEANGCRLLDDRGNTYVDWMSGSGCALLGYRQVAIEEAIREQFVAGPTLSLYHSVEVETARALIETIPCAERVAFGKHGSDALTAAVRIARAYTGRPRILHYGFHGFHDWYVSRYRNRPGLPHESAEWLVEFPYNDLPALERLLADHRGSVAAVLMEPENVVSPHRGYLDGVRELARAHGALLIFDEVWTAFRLARGGAQERYGVTPDLACYGKPLANGMPLSAVVGREKYMRLLPSVAYGMTYRDETYSLAACRALLRVVHEQPVTTHIQTVGARIRREIVRTMSRYGIRGAVVGIDGRLGIEFDDQGGWRRERLLALFARECVARGVLTSGLVIPNFAHDEAAIARSLEVFDEALAVLKGAVGARADDPRKIAPLDYVVGHLDRVVIAPDGRLDVRGWLLIDDVAAQHVELVAPDGASILPTIGDRDDVVAAFHLRADARACGYSVMLPAERFSRDGDFEFEIRVRRGETIVFRCSVLYRPGWERPILGDTQWLSIGC
jgi:glutamate-1-semialdehyde 2,1-aminomutase